MHYEWARCCKRADDSLKHGNMQSVGLCDRHRSNITAYISLCDLLPTEVVFNVESRVGSLVVLWVSEQRALELAQRFSVVRLTHPVIFRIVYLRRLPVAFRIVVVDVRDVYF